jgi:hypothetical protein
VYVDKYFKKFEQELTLKFVTIFLDVVLYEIFCNRILYKPLYVFYVNFTRWLFKQEREYHTWMKLTVTELVINKFCLSFNFSTNKCHIYLTQKTYNFVIRIGCLLVKDGGETFYYFNNTDFYLSCDVTSDCHSIKFTNLSLNCVVTLPW